MINSYMAWLIMWMWLTNDTLCLWYLKWKKEKRRTQTPLHQPYYLSIYPHLFNCCYDRTVRLPTMQIRFWRERKRERESCVDRSSQNERICSLIGPNWSLRAASLYPWIIIHINVTFSYIYVCALCTSFFFLYFIFFNLI